jgi:CheY-like chemotaxis protein
MPQMNGFEVCESILAIDINVKVCFMSSAGINREALRDISSFKLGMLYQKAESIKALARNPIPRKRLNLSLKGICNYTFIQLNYPFHQCHFGVYNLTDNLTDKRTQYIVPCQPMQPGTFHITQIEISALGLFLSSLSCHLLAGSNTARTVLQCDIDVFDSLIISQLPSCIMLNLTLILN